MRRFLTSILLATLLAAAALVWLTLLVAGSAGAHQDHEVKAAIIYNIAKFVEWPAGTFPSQDAPLVVGVLDLDHIAEDFDIIAGKSVQGRRLLIKKITRSDDFKKCQVVFFGEAGRKTAASVLSNLSALPILTVTDEVENFAQGGGIISLVSEAGKIRFLVNMKAARRAGLKISSQLLKLAKIVDGEEK